MTTCSCWFIRGARVCYAMRCGSFNSSEDATLALGNLKAFSDGGIDNVTVSASKGGYNFEVYFWIA